MLEHDAYHELCAYTLSLGDAAFIHQLVVDTFAVQNADPATKPIRLTFALLGLYLHTEHGFTGRQIQRVHVLLARRKRSWPNFALPPGTERGSMTARDVLARPPGAERAAAIRTWCSSVWQTCMDTAPSLAGLLAEHPGVLSSATSKPRVE